MVDVANLLAKKRWSIWLGIHPSKNTNDTLIPNTSCHLGFGDHEMHANVAMLRQPTEPTRSRMPGFGLVVIAK